MQAVDAFAEDDQKCACRVSVLLFEFTLSVDCLPGKKAASNPGFQHFLSENKRQSFARCGLVLMVRLLPVRVRRRL